MLDVVKSGDIREGTGIEDLIVHTILIGIDAY